MTTTQAILICRTPGNAADDWYHLFPAGETDCQAHIDGKWKDITLVVDDTAYARMRAAMAEHAKADNWRGYLVGQEHFAHQEDKSSEAYAWCRDLESRDTGIWGRFEKTSLGEATIGSVYIYRSPVAQLEHIAGRKYRPVALEDIGLTNKPMFRTLAAAYGRAADNPQEDAMLERMRTVLGLSTDATEDQVVARVRDALEKETQLETTQQDLTDLQATVLAREADAFVEEHKDIIEDSDEARADVKKQFIAAREPTEALFKRMRKQAGGGNEGRGAQRVLARESARTPEGDALGEAPTAADEANAKRISARAHEICNKEGLTFPVAFDRARREVQQS